MHGILNSEERKDVREWLVKWKVYEIEKARIIATGPNPLVYENQIRELLERLEL